MQQVITIRPKIIFKEIEQRFPNQYITWQVGIPATEIGGMTLLESSILVSLIKIFEFKNIFEFGTYMGATTMLFALNTPQDAKIISLDIDPNDFIQSNIDSSKILINDKDNDAFLTKNVLHNGAKYIKTADKSMQRKITLLLCDSLKLDIATQQLKQKFDFIFIDGGHDYEIIKKDTENALEMLQHNGIIAWHDYESKIHTNVTKYVNEFSQNHTIYHVANTMIAFMLCGNLRLNYV